MVVSFSTVNNLMTSKLKEIFFILVVTVFSFSAISQNTTDENNRKQGHWVFKNKTKKLPGYKPDQIVEEGNYENNRKVGVWTFYFNNGKIKHTLTYINNKPNGPAVFYYKNGNLREKGTWKNNRWIGPYEMYYANGNLKNQFKYNNQGIKHGPQKFFHENGNIKVSGTWNNGDEGTDIHEYEKNGSPNTKRYKAGPPLKINKPKPIVKKEIPLDTIVKQEVIVKQKSKPKKTPFDGNGYQEFKDRKGRNIRVGEFKNGYLVDGKTFEYNSKGKISITKIIENGKVTKIIDHSTLK